MNRKIIEILSNEFGLSPQDAAAIYNHIFSVMADAFAKGKNLNIPEFGKFTLRFKKTSDGKRVRSIKFSPVLKIAKEVNKNYDELVPVALKEVIKIIKHQNGNSVPSESADENKKLYSQLTETSEEVAEKFDELPQDDSEISFDLENMDDKMFEQFILSESNPLSPDEDLEVKDSNEFNIENEIKREVIHTDESNPEDFVTEAAPEEITDEFSGFDLATEDDNFKLPDNLKQLHEEIESYKKEDINFTKDDPENDFNNIFAPTKKDMTFEAGINAEIDINQIKSFDDIFMPIAETGNVKDTFSKSAPPQQNFKDPSPQRNLTEEIESLKVLHDDINDLHDPQQPESEITEEDISNLNYANGESIAENEIKEKEETEDDIRADKIEELNLIDNIEEAQNYNSDEDLKADQPEETEDFNIFAEDFYNPEKDNDESVLADEKQNINKMEDKNFKDDHINDAKDDIDRELEKIEEANAKDKILIGEGSSFDSFDPLAGVDDYEKKLNEEVEKIYSGHDDATGIAKDLDDKILEELNKKIENLEGEIKNKIEQTEKAIEKVPEEISKPAEPENKKLPQKVEAVEKKPKDLPAEKTKSLSSPEEKRKLFDKYAPDLKKMNTDELKSKKRDKKTYTTLVVFLFVICGLILLYGIFNNTIFREPPPTITTEIQITTEPPPVEQVPPVQQEQQNVPPQITEEPVTTPPTAQEQEPQQQTPPPVQTQPPPTTTARQIIENNIIYNETANGFTIQAGSFKDKPNAESRLSQLKRSGLSGFVEEADLGEKGKFFRVKIGYYKTLDEARMDAGKIK